MKEKLRYWMQWFREGAVEVFKGYPVELLLILYGCVGCFLIYEMDWSDSCNIKFVLAPLFMVLALIVNNLAGQSVWRKLYWVCWTPIVPLSFWGGLEDWVSSTQGLVTSLVLLPLALLACRRAVSNERFVCNLIIWLRSVALAVIFANVALGLFAAILFSTTYIFGLEGEWIERVFVYALILCETLITPVLFLMMSDRWRNAECSSSRILDMLLNYIVTPAMLIYTAILYLYMLKIVAVWSLPRGGVAYLVFGFTIFALVVKACQLLLAKRIYDWFFDRFSLIALPVQLLFWVGVMQRISEYGLTQPRVWLLVCGGLMTLCVLLFLVQRTGRYLYVCLAAMVVSFVMVYIPAANPECIANRSQFNRAERMALEVGWLGDDGRLALTPMAEADTVRAESYRNLYEALSYLEDHDKEAFGRFGITEANVLLGTMPDAMQTYCRWGYFPGETGDYDNWFRLEMPVNTSLKVDDAYPNLYPNLNLWGEGYSYDNDTLLLYLGHDEPVREITSAKLLERLTELAGFTPVEYPDVTKEQLAKLFVYEDDFCRIVFESLDFKKPDSVLTIRNVTVRVVMTR